MRRWIYIRDALQPEGDVEIMGWSDEKDCFDVFVMLKPRAYNVILEAPLDRFAAALQEWIDTECAWRAPGGGLPRVDPEKIANALRPLSQAPPRALPGQAAGRP